jgi:small subunit ribosomal protein S14
MATKSIVERNKKRTNLIKKNFEKRLALKNQIRDESLSYEDRFNLINKLSKLPRNSSTVRLKNICKITGRSKGVYRKFKLCRNKIREFASYGLIPGLVKASW